MNTLMMCLLATGVRLVSADEKVSCTQPICCDFIGALWTGNRYKFDLADLQNALGRCEIVSYSRYHFKLINNTGLHVYADDINALDMLKNSGKSVYVTITYDSEKNWAKAFDLQNERTTESEMDELVKFLKEYKISGVIMEQIFLYDKGEPFLDQQVIAYATKIKSKMDNLKVGLSIYGKNYEYFSNETAFDYNAANTVIDHYFVTATELNECTPQLKNTSVNPINSDDYNLYTLENVCSGVKESKMDKCKVYVKLQVSVVESNEDAEKFKDRPNKTSYSRLCLDATNGVDTSRWCSDSTSMLYEQGKYVRQYVSGLTLSVIERDDYDSCCGCRRFPVANTLIDGWEHAELQKCSKIDEICCPQK